MNEKLENMADKPKKKRKKIGKYDIIILLIGIGLMVAGIAGIVTSLDAADDYDNSTDIRTVDAVIETIERSEEVIGEKSKGNNKLMVDNINTFLETLHKMKVSYVVDGETYGGRYDVTTYSDSQERDQFYHQLKVGDTISVEVYRSRNGEYKIGGHPRGTCHHRSHDLRHGLPEGGAHQRQEEKEAAGQTALRQQTGRCFYELLGRGIHGSGDHDRPDRICCE